MELRITRDLVDRIRLDLSRPHAFAAERVGFVYCKCASSEQDILVLACDYAPVADGHYVDDSQFGAVIDSNAFRAAMQRAYSDHVSVSHVHAHPHRGVPAPSRKDLSETAKFVPDFFHARPELPHGALILSRDSLSARIWLGEAENPRAVETIRVVGAPLTRTRGSDE